jgi:hypothetical protein
MKLAIAIIIFIALLIMWRMAWRTRPILGLGMTIGVLLAGIIAAVVGQPDISLENFPIWLPPLPFATVAVTLLIFGILAWVWGDDEQGAGKHESAPPHSH